jgi:hypothetical protein
MAVGTRRADFATPLYPQMLALKKLQCSWMLRRVPLVRTDVSEEYIACFIMAKRISELGTMLAVNYQLLTLFLFR